MDGYEGRYDVLFERNGIGPLREMSVLDTKVQNWQKALDSLRGCHPHVDYGVDGVSAPRPVAVSELLPAETVRPQRCSSTSTGCGPPAVSSTSQRSSSTSTPATSSAKTEPTSLVSHVSRAS